MFTIHVIDMDVNENKEVLIVSQIAIQHPNYDKQIIFMHCTSVYCECSVVKTEPDVIRHDRKTTKIHITIIQGKQFKDVYCSYAFFHVCSVMLLEIIFLFALLFL